MTASQTREEGEKALARELSARAAYQLNELLAERSTCRSSAFEPEPKKPDRIKNEGTPSGSED